MVSNGRETVYAVRLSDGTVLPLHVDDDGALIVTDGGSSGGSVDQGTAGVDAWLVRVVSETFVKGNSIASLVGDNVIYTPASGKKIRLYYFGYSAGPNVGGVLVGLKFGAGSMFSKQYLIAPGQPYARNIQAGKRFVDGGIDESLYVNLDIAQTVYVDYELEEI